MNAKSGTFVLAPTLRDDVSAMHLDDALRDGETQSKPLMHPAVARVLLPERVKDVRQKLAADSLAVIGNGNFHVRRPSFHADANPAARRREFDGVGQEICHGLLQAAGIP